MVSVLFVCLGNICRSPTAEAVFRARCAREGLVDDVKIDSAGTGAWHVGEPPDRRAQAAALERGTDISRLRARQVVPEDFILFDYIIAMDASNLSDLEAMRLPDSQCVLKRMLDDVEASDTRDVPDPYYGGEAGFERVLDLLELGADALLKEWQSRGLL